MNKEYIAENGMLCRAYRFLDFNRYIPPEGIDSQPDICYTINKSTNDTAAGIIVDT